MKNFERKPACKPLIRIASFLVFSLSAAAAAGCGETLAPVSGTVKFEGKPVTEGTLVFSPVAGKSGTATIQSDGTYKVETYKPGDGAVVGPNRVVFTPRPLELTDEQKKDTRKDPPPPPFMGLIPKESTVEIKRGNNTVDIELVPRPENPKDQQQRMRQQQMQKNG